MRGDPLAPRYKSAALRAAKELVESLEKHDTYMAWATLGEVAQQLNLAIHWGRAGAEGGVIFPGEKEPRVPDDIENYYP
jgi:alpha-D-ribose 1-methylphosphonate 5-triphosphate synthase subunit PhnI